MDLLNDTYGILIAYNIWANQQTLQQIKTLSQDEFVQKLGGSFPSLKLTLNHLLESDWLWLHHWQGMPIAAVQTD